MVLKSGGLSPALSEDDEFIRLNRSQVFISLNRLRVDAISLTLSLIKSKAIPSGAKITNRLDKMDSPDLEDRGSDWI